MNLYKALSKYTFPLLCLALFLLRLPPVFPFLVTSDFLSTHSIARYIVTALLLHTIYGIITKQKSLKIRPALAAAVALYFLTQSFSVIDTVNVGAYLSRYKTIVFAVMAFITATGEVDSKQKIHRLLWVLVATVGINLAFEAVIYFQPPLLFPAFQSLVNDSYFQDLMVNMDRDRYFVNSYDAVIIPVMFYLFFNTKKAGVKIGLALLVVLVIVFSLLSNFRTQLLVALAMTGASIVIFIRQHVKSIFALGSALLILFLIYRLLIQAGTYTALDRIVSPENLDMATVYDRFYFWQRSVDIGLTHPVFGIGLGNYYEYLSEIKTVIPSTYDPKNTLTKITWVHPHNIFFGLFVETGLLGLLAFIFLLGCFAFDDYRILKTSSRLGKALVLSFWGLFSFSLINPATTLDYAVLFWIIRVMLASLAPGVTGQPTKT